MFQLLLYTESKLLFKIFRIDEVCIDKYIWRRETFQIFSGNKSYCYERRISIKLKRIQQNSMIYSGFAERGFELDAVV